MQQTKNIEKMIKYRPFILCVLFLGVVLGHSMHAQNAKYSTFYNQRNTLFDKLPISNKDIIFLGNSITNGGEWTELFNNSRVKNRGISGDVCEGVYDRLYNILEGTPKKIFLLIGINDVARGASAVEVVSGIEKIVRKIQTDSPRTKIYVQSLLPVNEKLNMFQGHTSKHEVVKDINKQLAEETNHWGVNFIDLYPHFLSSDGLRMDTKYTNDGLHLLGEGYVLWFCLINKYV